MWDGTIYSFHSACPGLPVATTYSVTQHQSTLHSYGEWSNFQTYFSRIASDFPVSNGTQQVSLMSGQIFVRGVINFLEQLSNKGDSRGGALGRRTPKTIRSCLP